MEREDTSRLTPAEGRHFAFTLAGAFLVLAGILWWREHETPFQVCAGISAVFFVLGVAVPGQLGPLHRAWMGMALLISRVTTPIFMGIIYYLALTPTGVLRRIFGNDPVRVDREVETYWVRRTDDGSRTDMHRQF